MFKLTYTDILNEIKNKTGLSEEDINSRVNKKLALLSDLISKEGAAHIIANELGVKLFPEYSDKKLKIKGLVPGLNFINIDAKVLSVFEVRLFKNEKREGKIASMIIGDETGISRLVIWDTKLIELIESGKIKDNDTISIKNAYCKENNNGLELHLGSKGGIIVNPENVVINEIKHSRIVNQKQIKDLKENEIADINGTIVQVFEPRFYTACPECNKKAEMTNGVFLCNEHGSVLARETPIVNFFLDDGTDNIRVVCFREIANKVLNNNFAKIRENPSEFDIIKNDILGRQVKVTGRVNKNAMFDRLELTAQNIEELDPKQLIEELNKEN
ncbi:hypothetical protein HYX18_03360 [Candidatus Woesearchaeota archaeon]|nr:hypothetical protein [Candidatus Woesearchaeota archaeon]